MSMQEKDVLTCPRCGRRIEYTRWDSINTDLEFAVSGILSGELFKVKCERCGYITNLDYPILFNDMIHKVMIYRVFPEQVKEAERTLRMMQPLGNRHRIVTSQADFKEKTNIFCSGMDDRIVEILKLIAIAELMEKQKGRIQTVSFLNTGEELLVEAVVDGRSAYFSYNMDFYDHLERQFGGSFNSSDDNAFVIDNAWALGFINRVSYMFN